MPEKIRIAVQAGRIKPPIWESRKVAKNWAAIIRSPNLRDWLPWGEDNASFSIDKLSVGIAVEFGAERLTEALFEALRGLFPGLCKLPRRGECVEQIIIAERRQRGRREGESALATRAGAPAGSGRAGRARSKAL